MKHSIPYSEAIEIAYKCVAHIEPYCHAVEVAGSLRREKPEVGDIEIVAIPYMKFDMFLASTDEPMINDYDFNELGTLGKNGNKYKQITLREGISLDLFLVTPPAQWGVQLLLRTGPAEYSKKFVTPKNKGGMLRTWQRCKDGALWNVNGQPISTPEEEDVYEAIGMPFIKPRDRR